jgi:ABC-type phosphate transport system substrate-binding protein
VKKTNLLKLAVVGVAATVLPLTAASQAFADYAPQPNDVVGVGGDTPQYAVDLVINGDTSGHLGFDESTGVNRVVPFDATADGNGRQAYAPGSTESSPILLNPTDVLRAGDNPVQRVPSSGAALLALEADTSSPETINYVASATAPSNGNGVPGGLDYIKFGTDSIQIAVDKTLTNAPAGLSATDLAKIYNGTWTTWGQVATNGTTSSGDTIIPEIPPSTSSIYSKFVAALVAAVPSFSIDSAVVKTVEQNDPTTITGASTPADAIVPFSAARLNLWNKGYFFNPGTAFPGAGSPLTAGVSLLSGTSPNGGASLNIALSDYFVWRANDTTIGTPYQPGGTLNWVNTLFYNPSGTPYIFSPEGQTLIAASGVTPVATPALLTASQ